MGAWTVDHCHVVSNGVGERFTTRKGGGRIDNYCGSSDSVIIIECNGSANGRGLTSESDGYCLTADKTSSKSLTAVCWGISSTGNGSGTIC